MATLFQNMDAARKRASRARQAINKLLQTIESLKGKKGTRAEVSALRAKVKAKDKAARVAERERAKIKTAIQKERQESKWEDIGRARLNKEQQKKAKDAGLVGLEVNFPNVTKKQLVQIGKGERSAKVTASRGIKLIDPNTGAPTPISFTKSELSLIKKWNQEVEKIKNLAEKLGTAEHVNVHPVNVPRIINKQRVMETVKQGAWHRLEVRRQVALDNYIKSMRESGFDISQHPILSRIYRELQKYGPLELGKILRDMPALTSFFSSDQYEIHTHIREAVDLIIADQSTLTQEEIDNLNEIEQRYAF